MEKNELQSSSSIGQFNAIVGPLETKAGRRLSGPGLSTCIAAFNEDDERFAALAADALERGRNPLALLIRMVADGDHLTESVAPRPAPATNGVCTHDSCSELDHCKYAASPTDSSYQRRYGRGMTSAEMLAPLRAKALVDVDEEAP